MRLSQQTYIERILKRFNTQSCSFGIIKGDRFSKGQCPHNDIKRDHMCKTREIPISGKRAKS